MKLKNFPGPEAACELNYRKMKRCITNSRIRVLSSRPLDIGARNVIRAVDNGTIMCSKPLVPGKQLTAFKQHGGIRMIQHLARTLAKKAVSSILAIIVATPMSSVAGATCPTDVSTGTQFSSGFENQSLAPFSLCTYQSPNYGDISNLYAANGDYSYNFFWYESSYNGTRDTKGVEACSNFATYKEGWYGFSFYLPSSGYPKNKTATIAQIFQDGACNSWAAMLVVQNGALYLYHRDYCGTATETLITSSIQYDAWKPIIIHWVASHENAGTIQVWYANQIGSQNSPTYSATGLNFGFGTWSGDTLASGNQQVLKFGMYNWDTTNYTSGETRTIYFDCVNQLEGNPSGAWNTVNPTT
jgi:hypothetical protein